MTEYLKEYLKVNDVEYKKKEKLSKYSTIKIGGEAEIIAYPDTEDNLTALISFCRKISIKHKIVGNMSNILPSDNGYKGVIIKTDRLNSFEIFGNTVRTGCGVKLPILSKYLADAGLSGFEGLSGIPGQIGGSVCGNAGAFGREMSDIVSSVIVYSPEDDKKFEISRDKLDFSYRKSMISEKSLVLLSVKFSFTNSERGLILSEMRRCREIRKAKQPIDYPSLGSFFMKTKEGIPAARLIDECGLKGTAIGGAMVSTKHAGFIINSSSAKSADVKSLSSLVEECVFERFSVKLCREVEYLEG